MALGEKAKSFLLGHELFILTLTCVCRETESESESEEEREREKERKREREKESRIGKLPFSIEKIVEEISFDGDRETLTTDGWNQRLWKRRRKKKTEIRLPGDLDS